MHATAHIAMHATAHLHLCCANISSCPLRGLIMGMVVSDDTLGDTDDQCNIRNSIAANTSAFSCASANTVATDERSTLDCRTRAKDMYTVKH
jgi:hypothetical protein